MKWIYSAILLLMVLANGGCGGDVTIVASTGNGVIVVSTSTDPNIVLAQFRQDPANRIVIGTIEYNSPLADIGTMTISVTDPSGTVISRTVIDLVSFRGLSNGTIPFTIDYGANPPGTYSFSIFVTNVAGHLSNPVFGTFRVP